MNSSLLVLNVAAGCGLTLLALKLGKETLVAWLSLLAVAMNLFVLKQITLFGLDVTASDALAVAYLLGLNLIQEFYGPASARKTVWTSFFVSCGFVLLAQIFLLYSPNSYDLAQPHFSFLLGPLPRLIVASLFSFFAVQFLDIAFFKFLKNKMQSKYLPLRIVLSLSLSQLLDTVLFSCLGLYGLVASLLPIIFLSLFIKAIVILLSAPFTAVVKKMVPHATL